MNEERIEAALKELGRQAPRVSGKTVDDMVKKVNMLGRKRQQAAVQEPAVNGAVKEREPRKDIGGMKR